jgi:hypothetical protein
MVWGAAVKRQSDGNLDGKAKAIAPQRRSTSVAA